jgi:hypothetical protein
VAGKKASQAAGKRTAEAPARSTRSTASEATSKSTSDAAGKSTAKVTSKASNTSKTSNTTSKSAGKTAGTKTTKSAGKSTARATSTATAGRGSKQPPALSLTWDQALAWRMRRQHLDPLDGGSAVDIVRRLCGVQAQVPSAAAVAVAVRQSTPDPDATTAALADRTLVRTWAMRGTLHLLPVEDAGSYLSLLAAARTWDKGSWQKAFLPADRMAALTEATVAALAAGDALTRDELVSAVVEHTGDENLAEHMRSGWSAVLKPLAWQGVLCQGPSQGNRVTFVRPGAWSKRWQDVPEPDDAARVVIPAYLGAFGPATPATFDQWLLRGATPKATLRRWFDDLGDDVATVDVEGTVAYARTEDLDDLAASEPTTAVRLLPAFDQYVLGPGTADPHVVPQEHRGEVSRAAGWIAPVVVAGGRVTGTWEVDGGTPSVQLFPGHKVPAPAMKAETSRLKAITTRQAPA